MIKLCVGGASFAERLLALALARGNARFACHWMPGLDTMMQERVPIGYICPPSHKLFRDLVIVAQTCQM